MEPWKKLKLGAIMKPKGVEETPKKIENKWEEEIKKPQLPHLSMPHLHKDAQNDEQHKNHTDITEEQKTQTPWIHKENALTQEEEKEKALKRLKEIEAKSLESIKNNEEKSKNESTEEKQEVFTKYTPDLYEDQEKAISKHKWEQECIKEEKEESQEMAKETSKQYEEKKDEITKAYEQEEVKKKEQNNTILWQEEKLCIIEEEKSKNQDNKDVKPRETPNAKSTTQEPEKIQTKNIDENNKEPKKEKKKKGSKKILLWVLSLWSITAIIGWILFFDTGIKTIEDYKEAFLEREEKALTQKEQDEWLTEVDEDISQTNSGETLWQEQLTEEKTESVSFGKYSVSVKIHEKDGEQKFEYNGVLYNSKEEISEIVKKTAINTIIAKHFWE